MRRLRRLLAPLDNRFSLDPAPHCGATVRCLRRLLAPLDNPCSLDPKVLAADDHGYPRTAPNGRT